MRIGVDTFFFNNLTIPYGAYREAGARTAPSNAAFCLELRRRSLKWSVRDLEEVAELAEASDMSLGKRIPMPANNLGLMFWK